MAPYRVALPGDRSHALAASESERPGRCRARPGPSRRPRRGSLSLTVTVTVTPARLSHGPSPRHNQASSLALDSQASRLQVTSQA